MEIRHLLEHAFEDMLLISNAILVQDILFYFDIQNNFSVVEDEHRYRKKTIYFNEEG